MAKQQYFAGDSVGFYQTGNEFLHTENFILDDYPNSKNDSYTYILGETLNGVSNDLYDYDYIKFEVDSWSDYTFNISRK